MKNEQSKYIVGGVLALALVFGVLYYLKNLDEGPSVYDGFAQCLAEKGAKFYGAFWCPHCNDQKKLFGGAKKYLPYVECSTSDSQGQTQVCVDQKIESYPTWIFSDNSKLTGEVSLKILAEKTSCALPDNTQ